MISRRKLWRALEYAPHDGQTRIHAALDDSSVSRVVGLFGRRAGKSHAASHEAIFQALKPADRFGPPLVYLVSDTYSHSKALFTRALVLITTKLRPLIEKVNISPEPIITLKTGARIMAKSADNPASLAGDGLSFAVIDESGFVKDYPIEVLEPALAERRGQVLAIGTPDNRNWYSRWYNAGTQGVQGFRSLHAPSTVNPHFPPEEIESARTRGMPQRLIDKYFGAVFVDDEGAIFTDALIRAATTLKGPSNPIPGRMYVAGLDLARTVDFNVLTILDITETPARLVHLERWNGTTWEIGINKAISILERYNAVVQVDSTGSGDPVFETFSKRYAKARSFKFTGQSKPVLVETLELAFERGDLEIFFDPAMDSELRSLRATTSQNGVKYAAPDGLHDDIPMSLALAWHNIASKRRAPGFAGLEDFKGQGRRI